MRLLLAFAIGLFVAGGIVAVSGHAVHAGSP